MNVIFREHLSYVRGVAMKMNAKNSPYRYMLLYYFRKGKRAANDRRKIGTVCRNDAVTRTYVSKFTKFCSGDFNINDAPRSGHPTEIDSSYVKRIVDANPSQAVWEIATALNIPYTSLEKHLPKLRYVSRLNIWIQDKLT